MGIKNNRGSIMIITMGFVLVFTMLGLGSLHHAGLQNEMAEKLKFSNQAYWRAEAGIQKAISRINYNKCTNFFQCGTSPAIQCTDCNCAGASKCLTETFNDSLGVQIADYNLNVNTDNSIIISAGTSYADTTVANPQKRKIGVSSSPFAFALFGDDTVNLDNNNHVDSYDSSKLKSDGTPCLYNQVCADGSTNVNSTGNVGTNGTATDITQGNGTTISGQVSSDNNITLPTVSVPSNFNATNSGQTGTAPSTISGSGDYTYDNISDSLTVTGTVRLKLTTSSATNSITLGNGRFIRLTTGSSLTIYATGPGGIAADNPNVAINDVNTPLPTNLIFYSMGSSDIIIKNNSPLYMAIYAPNAAIQIHNTNPSNAVYGSFIGKSVNFHNNNTFHYDEALKKKSPGIGNFVILSWQECNPYDTSTNCT